MLVKRKVFCFLLWSPQTVWTSQPPFKLCSKNRYLYQDPTLRRRNFRHENLFFKSLWWLSVKSQGGWGWGWGGSAFIILLFLLFIQCMNFFSSYAVGSWRLTTSHCQVIRTSQVLFQRPHDRITSLRLGKHFDGRRHERSPTETWMHLYRIVP